MVTSEGSLVRRDLAQIVHSPYVQRWSGVLILSNGGIGTSASSSPPSRSGVPPRRPRQGFLSAGRRAE
jgi:hypothetical protein